MKNQIHHSSFQKPFEVMGGYYVNSSGELFMEKYDPRKELASRDIVSRAIDSELKKEW